MAEPYSRKTDPRCITNFKHGCTNTPEFRTWRAMQSRCYNANDAKNYTHYGARGIRVCDRWLGPDGFSNFLADMGLKPSPRHSLDRIDFNGNYEPGNCRWATAKEQHNNTRTNRLLTHEGITKTVAQWAEMLGIRRGTLWERLARGWSIADALTRPKRAHVRKR